MTQWVTALSRGPMYKQDHGFASKLHLADSQVRVGSNDFVDRSSFSRKRRDPPANQMLCGGVYDDST
jgi:hypothetical protein